MKERLLESLQEVIDRIEYGDISRNKAVSILESLKEDIDCELKDKEEDDD